MCKRKKKLKECICALGFTYILTCMCVCEERGCGAERERVPLEGLTGEW